MKNKEKSKEQLINELAALRQQITELKASKIEPKKVEQEVLDSEEMYSTLVRTSPDAVTVTDLKGYVTQVSQRTLELHGYQSAEQLLGKSAFEFIAEEDHKRAMANLQRTLKEGTVRNKEYSMLRKDGTRFLGELNATLIKDAYGKPKAFIATTRDITQRKEAEQELKNSEERFRRFLSVVSDGIYRYDPKNKRYDFISTSFEMLTGYTLTEIKADPAGVNRRIIHPEDEERVTREFEDHVKKGHGVGPFHIEYRVVRKAGQLIWVSDRRDIEFTPQGKIYRINGLIRDITDRKKAEESLRESEERFRGLSEASFEGICIHENGEIIDANEVFAKTYGYELSDVIGMHALEFTAPESYELILRNINSGYDKPYETVGLRKDGSTFLVEIHSKTISYKGRTLRVEAFRDITERKQAEEALRESVKRFRDVAANTGDWIWEVDEKGRYTYSSPVVEQILGYKPDEVLDKHFYDFFHPDDRDKLKKAAFEVFGKKEAFVNFSNRNVHKDGHTVILETSGVPILRDDGKLLGYRGADRDITERKRAEEKLRSVEQEKATILNSMAEHVVYYDKEMRILWANKAAGESVGLPPEEMAGRHCYEVWRQQSKPCTNCPVIETIRSGEPHQEELTNKDGRVWFVNAHPVRNANGGIVGAVEITLEITERKKMEGELLKAKKLESIGILAGGIAHDFNNILTGILGNISLAKAEAGSEDEIFKILLKAEKACLKAKDLTQQLLTFSKGGAPTMKTTCIAELIEVSAAFALRGSKVRYQFSKPSDLWPVEIDQGQISQVINNLIINADQAMPEGGIIKIHAENTPLKRENTLRLKQGKYVKLTVEDQGIGIPKQHLQKIFDPYFTTKHKGDGLGLTTSYSIVKSHGGYIAVQSQLGVGTTFLVYLPASARKIPKKKPPKEKSPVGKGRILVMDDEEIVRDVIGDLLKILGYEVEFARDGLEVIEHYKKARDSAQGFDAIIMDLTVPGGMGGKESIQRLLEIDPEAKAIVSSGYSNDPVMSDFKKYGFRGVVAKPYKIEELSEALHRVLTSMSKTSA